MYFKLNEIVLKMGRTLRNFKKLYALTEGWEISYGYYHSWRMDGDVVGLPHYHRKVSSIPAPPEAPLAPEI